MPESPKSPIQKAQKLRLDLKLHPANLEAFLKMPIHELTDYLQRDAARIHLNQSDPHYAEQFKAKLNLENIEYLKQFLYALEQKYKQIMEQPKDEED